ncbi:P-II family nitrogen regulator [Acetobacterium woodii]|uniref:Nitrogen regulatory protein PII n=1 Tax=Acetobacterium woodii (strain ATCC 29683 / DSM 1030 / JCM 2381 / KCTC 1655 / WB1) TaxID=931626 RepID=H6LKH7_ACEWD|nr:P-II family nitrogen regulator [Acetobacterium woodii]AFA47567.1 nitrogen regulatory protein PII [Acetobacterium woodii DSM 1030]
MKLIEAIIRPEKLEPLKDAFLEAKVRGMSVRQILGCGNQYGWVAHNRGTEVMMNMIPKIEIKIVVADDKVEETVQLIMTVVRTGEIGDGKIFIKPVEECIRIRTGERGDIAL